MNLTIKRTIFCILIIINCITIFNFSSQDSKKSSETSSVVVDKVVDTISTVNKKAKKEDLRKGVTFWVRKSAHFSIYALLGIWTMLFLNTFDNLTTGKKIMICVIFGLAYAISDEFHQSFVSGRSMELRDMIIDTCGCFVGSGILGMILGTRTKIRNNKNTKQEIKDA